MMLLNLDPRLVTAAMWNVREGLSGVVGQQVLCVQVEMWLHATSPAVNGKRLVDDGEAVLMEVSRKFTMGGIRSLAYRSGWFIQVSPYHSSLFSANVTHHLMIL